MTDDDDDIVGAASDLFSTWNTAFRISNVSSLLEDDNPSTYFCPAPGTTFKYVLVPNALVIGQDSSPGPEEDDLLGGLDGLFWFYVPPAFNNNATRPDIDAEDFMIDSTLDERYYVFHGGARKTPWSYFCVKEE